MFRAKTAKLRNKILRKIILLLFLLIFLSLFVVFRNLEFLTNKNSIISPLSKTTSKNAQLEELLLSENIPFSKINVASDSSFIVHLQEGGEVNISAKKGLPEQVSSLQLILSRLTIEGKKFKFLDLRFEKAVITF